MFASSQITIRKGFHAQGGTKINLLIERTLGPYFKV